jgi:DNA invertase Pin-like site-specific DNA recombinase
MGAFSEFERALIRERQREGIAIKKAAGKSYHGRKPKLTTAKLAELRARAATGEPKTALAKEFGISRQQVYEYLNNAKKGTADRWEKAVMTAS